MSRRTINTVEKRLTISEELSNQLPNAKKVVAASKDLPHLQKPIKYLFK
jgi:hypothetical protein